MKAYKFNRQDRTWAPWAALCVLSLVAAMVFALPSVVFAQITGELSQDCDAALIGTEHVITVTVTEIGEPGSTVPMYFRSTDPEHSGTYMLPLPEGVADGIATFAYQVDSVGQVEISFYYVKQDGTFQSVKLDSITTTWTANEADLCSDAPGVTVGGKVTLNAKKKGALRIAVCAVDGSDVSNVDPESVRLEGVAPFHSKQKDSSLCPDGKDGIVDLVLKFKNRKVVEALEERVGELADGEPVDLVLTGMNDGKAFDVKWEATVKKKGKKHGKNNHYQDHKPGKAKGHNK